MARRGLRPARAAPEPRAGAALPAAAGARGPGPLTLLGTALLGFGFAFRILVPPAPVTAYAMDLLPGAVLASGAGVLFLDAVLRRAAVHGWSALALILVWLAGAAGGAAPSVARAFDFAAAAAAGLALSGLVRAHGLGPAFVRTFLAIATFVALLALAQALFQRDEMRAAAEDAAHELTATRTGRLFLASGRASATFVNPNVLAGFLLLAIPFAAAALAAGARKGRVVPALIAAALAGGFVAAGSAGATVALLLGFGALSWLRPSIGPRLRRASLAALAAAGAGLLLVAASFLWTWPDALLGSKAVTVRERLGYHALGWRLLPEAGVRGIGFEMCGELGPGVQRPGEPWSRYLHDGWFQLLVEGGPLTLLVLVPVVLAFARLRRRAADTAAPPQDARLARTFAAGAVAATAAAPLVVRSVTLLPLALEQPALDAALHAAVAGGIVFALGRAKLFRGGVPRAAVAVALAAATLHGFVDFDLYVGAFAAGFAAVVALGAASGDAARAAAASSGTGAKTAGAALAGFMLLALPLLVAPEALVRDAAVAAAARGDAGAVSREVLELARRDPDALAWVAAKIDPVAVLELERRGLARPLAEAPRVRSALALAWARLALRTPERAGEAAQRIAALVRAGERAESAIQAQLHRARLAARDHDGAVAAARASVAAAETWGLDAAEAPWLGDLRSYLQREEGSRPRGK